MSPSAGGASWLQKRVPLSKILTPEQMRERERRENELREATKELKRIMVELGIPIDENI